MIPDFGPVEMRKPIPQNRFSWPWCESNTNWHVNRLHKHRSQRTQDSISVTFSCIVPRVCPCSGDSLVNQYNFYCCKCITAISHLFSVTVRKEKNEKVNSEWKSSLCSNQVRLGFRPFLWHNESLRPRYKHMHVFFRSVRYNANYM